MLDVKINLLKNRLYITCSPYPEDPYGNGIHAIRKAAGKLSSGFGCITRITDIRPMDQQAVRQVREAREVLVDMGMTHAVRIGELPEAGHADIAAIEPEIIRRYSGSRCTVFTADTPEKAENLLDRIGETSRGENRFTPGFAGDNTL